MVGRIRLEGRGYRRRLPSVDHIAQWPARRLSRLFKLTSSPARAAIRPDFGGNENGVQAQPSVVLLQRWSATGLTRLALLLALGLMAVKLVVAATTPLAFDEALYWRYSRHLAAGYIDHPFINPLMIRLGVAVFGDTPLGVRLFAVLSALPATWAVWRTSSTLFCDNRLAAVTAIYFSLTLTMAAGSIVATSDEPVVVASAFILFFAAKIYRTGRGIWWLALGAAFGLGLCSKYTTIFFAPGLAVWLALAPGQRRWFMSPWLWAGAAFALFLFAPVLWWNASHEWASLLYQSGRLAVSHWTLRYLIELVGAVALLAGPPVLILAGLGISRALTRRDHDRVAVFLPIALALPILSYFVVHALHQRVQGNWPEPAYPALVVVAAWAAQRSCAESGPAASIGRWAAAAVIPLGLLAAAFVYTEAPLGILPLGGKDPRARVLGVGWPAVAARIEGVRAQTRLREVLTTDYPLASWTAFYLPGHQGVDQITQRMRWSAEPAPPPGQFSNGVLYICGAPCDRLGSVASRFSSVSLVGSIPRLNGTAVVATYSLYALKGPRGEVLDSPSKLPTAD